MVCWQYKFLPDGSSLDRRADKRFNAWDPQGRLLAIKVSYDEAIRAIDRARQCSA